MRYSNNTRPVSASSAKTSFSGRVRYMIPSTTSGVVSGLDRALSRGKAGDLTGLVQFDAAVNPGSSGGPLINDRGQVAGIVVALANPTDADTFIGIGFAVPIGAALGGVTGNGPAPPL